MKIFLILSLCFTSSLFAQNSKLNNHDLYALCKIWGLVKYYHPAVSQGKVDADSLLWLALNNNSKPNLDQVVANWFAIANPNPVEKITPRNNDCDSTTLRNYNINWIKELKFLKTQTKSQLLQLVNEPQNVGSYYSNPTIAQSHKFNSKNEKTAYSFGTNIKLLELFRVWNAIEYFYPYKYLLDRSWDHVLKKYIPIFKSIADEKDYQLAITQLAAELQDTHTDLKTGYQYHLFGKLGAPFNFQIVDQGAVITSIKDQQKTQKAGMSSGDLITRINGKPIASIISKNNRYIPASNPSVHAREAYNYLFSGRDSLCSVEGITKEGKPFKSQFERIPRTFSQEWDKDGIPNYQLSYQGKTHNYLTYNEKEGRLNPLFKLDDKAYVEFASLQSKEIDSLMNAIHGAKGIVFDLRGYNNSGYLTKVFDHLFTEPQWFGILSQADFAQPGKFCFVDYIVDKNRKRFGKTNSNAYQGKVVVLINEYSQSVAEMWAMAFKKGSNVTFIGSQTAGADGNITNIKLTDGNEIRFSGLGIYYPDGSETQRIGIKPDITVRPTWQSIKANQDVLLLRAFELIDGI